MDGEPRITTYLISLILVSFIIMSISYFIADGNEKYSKDFNTTQIETFNKMDKLKADIDAYSNSTDIKENPNIIDIIGSYTRGGIKLIRLSFTSITTTNDMIDDGANMVDLPQINILKTTLKLILFVLFIFGIFVAAIMKWRT